MFTATNKINSLSIWRIKRKVKLKIKKIIQIYNLLTSWNWPYRRWFINTRIIFDWVMKIIGICNCNRVLHKTLRIRTWQTVAKNIALYTTSATRFWFCWEKMYTHWPQVIYKKKINSLHLHYKKFRLIFNFLNKKKK